MENLFNKSIKEMRKMTFKKIVWLGMNYLEFTLNDGQFCKAGKEKDFDRKFMISHTFNPSKKITKIEVIIDRDEYIMCQIHKEEIILVVGDDDHEWVKRRGVRKEVFEIADDEQLIGCRLYRMDENFEGLKWMKMKVSGLGELSKKRLKKGNKKEEIRK
jgi:hypothetical protein